VVLEEEDESPGDPEGELFCTPSDGSDRPPILADRALRGVRRLASGIPLIYTLHTLNN
jgi:hypothetical protein